jgi:hypothetical protein
MNLNAFIFEALRIKTECLAVQFRVQLLQQPIFLCKGLCKISASRHAHNAKKLCDRYRRTHCATTGTIRHAQTAGKVAQVTRFFHQTRRASQKMIIKHLGSQSSLPRPDQHYSCEEKKGRGI